LIRQFDTSGGENMYVKEEKKMAGLLVLVSILSIVMAAEIVVMWLVMQ